MPIVLYTDAPFEPGDIIDTRDYSSLNEEALAQASPEEREVEALLEDVRREAFPEAPSRISSVLGIPIPRVTPYVYREGKGWHGEIPAPEPEGIGEHCYHIEREPGARGDDYSNRKRLPQHPDHCDP